nr:MAG TPA: hypothetical protein [Caudoviricetes sp.]
MKPAIGGFFIYATFLPKMLDRVTLVWRFSLYYLTSPILFTFINSLASFMVFSLFIC